MGVPLADDALHASELWRCQRADRAGRTETRAPARRKSFVRERCVLSSPARDFSRGDDSFSQQCASSRKPNLRGFLRGHPVPSHATCLHRTPARLATSTLRRAGRCQANYTGFYGWVDDTTGYSEFGRQDFTVDLVEGIPMDCYAAPTSLT